MKLKKQLLSGYLLIFTLMIVVAVVMYLSTVRLLETQDRIGRSNEVIAKVNLLQRLLIDMQTAKRGYQITGEEEYLEPYDEGKTEYEKTMADLKALVSDNSSQVGRLLEIDRATARWHKVIALPQIEERRRVTQGTASMEDVIASVKAGAGEDIVNSLRDNFAKVIEIEKAQLDERRTSARASASRNTYTVVLATVLAIALGIIAMVFISRGIFRQVGGEPASIAEITGQIARGNLDVQLEGGTGILASIGTMLQSLRENRDETQRQDWLKTGSARLSEVMRGDPDVKTLASDVISEIADYLDAQVGALYLMGDGQEPVLSLLASYAYKKSKNLSNRFRPGEGLVGQAALEKRQILVRNIPDDYVKVTSGLGEHAPRFICVTPFLYNDRVKGVVELGMLNEISEIKMKYLAQAMPALAIAVESAEAKVKLQEEQRKAMLRVSYLQGLDSPVMAIDREYNVVFINAAGLILLGQTEEAVVGKKCYRLWKTGDCQTERCACARAMSESRVVVSRTNADLPDRNVPIQYAGSPLRDEGGRLLGAVESIIDVTELTEALEQSQRLSEELQAQQEELRTANEELEEQAQRLKESEERLKAQQEELQVTNEELEEKNELLERQTGEVEQARNEIEQKAEELALASKYKSEFLANMSHELRTPLNSLLLLAQSLVENKDGNLTEEQVKSAEIIHGSGADLLNLINEILDLSRIEAGRMELRPGRVGVSELAEGARTAFQHLAEEKALSLEVSISPEAPAEIVTDRKRVEQVIKNLVSNAIKFTETGGVTVSFGRPGADADLSRSGLAAEQALSISVKDTGIGIAPEQQKVIFEAFQQVDGGASRKYGGTGLGLSISRELARLLGGEIRLESEPGKGSTFTLSIPAVLSESRKAPEESKGAATVSEMKGRGSSKAASLIGAVQQIEDDRQSISKGDTVILVIEDDASFAGVLRDKCHERGFKCLAAPTGEAGLELAGEHLPHGVILDIRLPGMDGWAVLSALKDDIRTRHIPVHIVSVEEASTEALRKGAIGHATKPLDREELEEAFKRIESISAERTKRVLVVEDDDRARRSVVRLIGGADVEVDEALTGEQAIEALRANRYGCVILDLGLPDMDGTELLKKVEAEGVELPPVIVYTARDLSRKQEMDLHEYAESVVLKDVRSQERLLDEVSLFLHRMVSRMPERKKQIIRNLHEADALLREKKVMIVDDDMRTAFALSRLLSERGMKPLKAENGDRALQLLDQEPDVDLVLMDIMMPVMDGYEAIKRIRAQERFRKLPIIALTAKAMKEDRERCLASGANDYLSKPLDQIRLISMLRVWLYR